MESKLVQIHFLEFQRGEHLDEGRSTLLKRAMDASGQSYAPYSKFHVGAAILLEDKAIVTGANQENASYPCGICAERAALYSLSGRTRRAKILKMAIAVKNIHLTDAWPPMPCGMCRQVMCEFEANNGTSIELIIGRLSSTTWVFARCADLLPFCFDNKLLIANSQA